MAGFGAYLKVDGFNILPVMSFSMAATTFTGQNYGAGKIRQNQERIESNSWNERALYDRDRNSPADLFQTDHRDFQQ
mgnify:FL=1